VLNVLRQLPLSSLLSLWQLQSLGNPYMAACMRKREREGAGSQPYVTDTLVHIRYVCLNGGGELLSLSLSLSLSEFFPGTAASSHFLTLSLAPVSPSHVLGLQSLSGRPDERSSSIRFCCDTPHVAPDSCCFDSPKLNSPTRRFFKFFIFSFLIDNISRYLFRSSLELSIAPFFFLTKLCKHFYLPKTVCPIPQTTSFFFSENRKIYLYIFCIFQFPLKNFFFLSLLKTCHTNQERKKNFRTSFQTVFHFLVNSKTFHEFF
jgi:hypothetical protein